MNKNKFITCALAAMMLASLAIPASAANADYGNTTDVILTYGDDIPGAPDVDGAYTITIPSQVDLSAEDNGDDGVTLSGTGEVKFSGMIGQNDKVLLSVKSENNYQLIDTSNDTAVANYEMYTTTDENNGIELLNYSDEMGGCYFCSTLNYNYIWDRTQPMFTRDGVVTDMSNNFAKAFQGESVITLNFEENGPNEIFGKGTYEDTLTFNYQYGTANGDDFTMSESSTVNIVNGVMASTDDGHTGTTITCNNKNIIFDIDKDGTVIADSLAKYALKVGVDGEYEIELDVGGFDTNNGAMNSEICYNCTVENGAIVNETVSTSNNGNFNYYSSMNECGATLSVEWHFADGMNAYTDIDTFWGYNSCEF